MIRYLPLLFVAFGTTAGAQWLNYPAPGIPRLPNGKPNLSAAAPRSADGELLEFVCNKNEKDLQHLVGGGRQ